MERPVKKEIGLWIDHREAIIVTVTDDGEEIKRLNSDSLKHARYSGSAHSQTPEGLKKVTSEDRSDRKFMNNLKNYYDEIFEVVRGAS